MHWATPWGSNADAILPEICLFSLPLCSGQASGQTAIPFQEVGYPGGEGGCDIEKLEPPIVAFQNL